MTNQDVMRQLIALCPRDSRPWVRDVLERAMKTQPQKNATAVLMTMIGLLDAECREGEVRP